MLAELLPDPIMAELPSVPMRVRTTTWGVIRELSASGKLFTASDVRARVHSKVGNSDNAARYVDDLAAAGYLRRVDGAIAKHYPVYTMERDQADAPAIRGYRPEPIAFATQSLKLHIPRSHDGIWMLMRWLDANRGGFAASDLRRLIGDNIAWDEVEAYVKTLDRGGYIVRQTGCLPREPIYRVERKQVETPRLRADGAVISAAQRADHLWRAIKMLGFFTPRELAVAAASDEWPITTEQASRYAIDIANAGYLMLREAEAGPVFRLKARMNTGPAAPQVLRARFVWDPNLGRIMGETAFAEEVRR